MIDEKKIEKEARMHTDKVAELKGFDDSKPQHLAYCEGNADGFIAGAKWALQEFKKSLWHDPKEEPEDRSMVLMQYRINNREFNLEYWTKYNLVSPNLRNLWSLDITRWLYCKDLLPKEGGEEC